MSNYYLVYVLVSFLAVFSLTTARNLKHHQNLHEEVATGSDGLISYQSPTTHPQTLVAHNYDGPTIHFSKVYPPCFAQARYRPVEDVKCIPRIFPGRPGRPPS
ncbi:unnamed protein product [Trifolium pratense]|uniref:Uncharacterized protein n=1 Tax=Trifolium pratense TaxID=57577 RepID=A0ACB0LI43_TRIPR|nr:unnamed protein product [Trifolium pratense]